MRLLSIRNAAGVAMAGLVLLAACSANGTGAGSSAASASVAASAPASAAPSSSAAAGLVLAVAHLSVGDAVTGKDGKTLYFFTKDSNGSSACSGDCAVTWPPLTLASGENATAGDGVNASLIGSFTRADGSTQVTYGGHPLYYYAADSSAGDANGQGKFGLWFVASPTGSLPSPSASQSGSSSYSTRY